MEKRYAVEAKSSTIWQKERSISPRAFAEKQQEYAQKKLEHQKHLQAKVEAEYTYQPETIP
jgi:hypothetical protein